MKYASVIVLCVFAVVAFGDVVSVTYDTADTMNPNPSGDTWVWTGNGPYGSSGELRINQDTAYDQRPVLQWDLSSIAGATINSAVFNVYRYEGNSSGTLSADVYRVTESWDEATLVAPAPTFDNGTVWATGDAGSPNGWKTFDITDLVQAWVNGTYTNYGIICLGSGSSYYQRWCSKEYGSNLPYLAIDYTLDSDPPYVDTLDPADNDTDVDPATDIIFHAKDDGSGINTSTIDFTAEDENRLPGITVTVSSGGATSAGYGDNSVISGTLNIDDTDLNDVICTFDPDSNLPPQEITCTVAGTLADNVGNTMGSDFVWSFFVLGYDVDETTWGAIKAGY